MRFNFFIVLSSHCIFCGNRMLALFKTNKLFESNCIQEKFKFNHIKVKFVFPFKRSKQTYFYIFKYLMFVYCIEKQQLGSYFNNSLESICNFWIFNRFEEQSKIQRRKEIILKKYLDVQLQNIYLKFGCYFLRILT